ncbi:MAG: nuclease-related domain-containing protein [Steroidobacteraceae bacterium]
MTNLPPLTWTLVVCAGVVGWGLSWLWRWYRQRRARRALLTAITAVGSDYLVDVLVPDGMGSSFHLDFVLRTPRGAVVLDLRDVHGNVFGGDQMNEWTVMDGPHRHTFVNPQSALYDRIAAVKAIAGDMPVEGRIVFTRRARFPKGLPKWTLMVDSLSQDFPLIEGGTPGGPDPFDLPWQNIRNAVRPSLMAQARAVSG